MKVKQKKNVLRQPQRSRRHTQEEAVGGKALRAQSPLCGRGQASYSREVEDRILPPFVFGTQRSSLCRMTQQPPWAEGWLRFRNLAFWS